MKNKNNILTNPLMITGAVITAKPVFSTKPKYAPPPKKSTLKQKKSLSKPQIQQQKPIPEPEIVRVVPIKPEKEESDHSDNEPQFVLRQEPLNQKEIVQVHKPVEGQACIRYSHYKEKFKIVDGVLLEKSIDEQYCLSFVFKGQYKMILKSDDKSVEMNKINGGWNGLKDGSTYWLEIDEDPIQQQIDEQNYKPYIAPKENTCPMRNKKVELITAELKGMSISEINEKGEKFKELVEARDLEDILFK